jgi:hypothetical protein
VAAAGGPVLRRAGRACGTATIVAAVVVSGFDGSDCFTAETFIIEQFLCPNYMLVFACTHGNTGIQVTGNFGPKNLRILLNYKNSYGPTMSVLWKMLT